MSFGHPAPSRGALPDSVEKLDAKGKKVEAPFSLLSLFSLPLLSFLLFFLSPSFLAILLLISYDDSRNRLIGFEQSGCCFLCWKKIRGSAHGAGIGCK